MVCDEVGYVGVDARAHQALGGNDEICGVEWRIH